MNDPDPPPAAAVGTRRGLVLRAAIYGIAALALAAIAGVAWLGSESALRLVVDQLAARSGGRIVVEGAGGSLLTTMRAEKITLTSDGLAVTADEVALTWSPAALWSRAIRIDAFAAQRIRVQTGPKATSSSAPVTLALPLPVSLNRAEVGELVLADGASVRSVTRIGFGYRGDADSHAFSDIGLVTSLGRVSGEIRLAAKPPHAVSGKLALAGSELLRQADARFALAGDLDLLHVDGDAEAAGATLQAKAALAPFASHPLSALTLEARGVDVAAFAAEAPATALDITLRAAPRADGGLEGDVAATNARAGPIDAGAIPVASLSTRFAITDTRLELSELSAALGAGARVSGSGSLALGADRLPALAGSRWELAVRELDLAALHRRLAATRLTGRIGARLAEGSQHVDLQLTQQGIELRAVADITGRDVEVREFRARANDGELAGRGRVQLGGARRFEFTATATKLDPSRFGAFPPGSLGGQVAVAGQLEPAWSAEVELAFARGASLHGAPIAGKARFGAAARALRDAQIDVSLADATLHASGSVGSAADRLDFAIDVPELARIVALAGKALPEPLAEAKGRLQARGHFAGALAQPAFALSAHGEALAIAGFALGTLDLQGELAPPGAGAPPAAWHERTIALDVAAKRLVTPAGKYASAGARLAGTIDRHEARLTLTGEDLDAAAQFAGGAAAGPAGWRWSGSVLAFENRGTYAARLDAPARLEFGRDLVRAESAVLSFADGTFRLGDLVWEKGRISTQGAFDGLPLAAVARLAGTPLPLRSTVLLSGAWKVAAAPRLDGSVAIRRQRGELYVEAPGVRGAAEVALGVERMELTARFVDDALAASAMLDTRLGSAKGTLALGSVAGAAPGRIAAEAPLEAALTADLASLRLLQPWIGTMASVNGRVHVDLAAVGTRARAPVTGTLTGDELTLSVPQYGMHWSGGRVRARVADNAVVLDDFVFAAGEGRFTVSGTLLAGMPGEQGSAAAGPGARLVWRAENFRAFNQPDLRLIVDGEGTIGYAERKLALSGKLVAREGHVEFARSRVGQLGDDVVVVGRAPPEAAAGGARTPVALAVDLELDAGSKLTVAAEGLATNIEGRVRVTTGADAALAARGSIDMVRGTYQAFGQRLAITRGRLLFDGPLDNPALDVVALRTNLAVEAGVEVSGTVRLPHVRLVSEPPVPDNEKLSWLVLGRGLGRTSGGDLAALQAAAGALFGQGGTPVGTSIARSVGLDDVAVRGSGATGSGRTGSAAGGVGGGVLAFGKRISENVYLVYEQGLTIANNALRIEYALNRNWTLRAEAGVVSGFGIYYIRAFE